MNVIQESFQEEDDIRLLIEDLRKYLKDNNIVYAEIFFAPSRFLHNGFPFEKMVSILDEGARVYRKK